MKNSKLLSAVMLSISAIHTVAPMAASASLIASKGVHAGSADNAPAVLKFQAEHKRMVPERLHEYERALAEQTGFTMAATRQDICGCISGSGSGWDDSKDDC